jgi:hypothetical protein
LNFVFYNIEEIAEKIKNKLTELNNNIIADCWICGSECHNWIVLLPENGRDSLGFGYIENKMRVAFIPVCKSHDLDNAENINIIKTKLYFKSQQLKN